MKSKGTVRLETERLVLRKFTMEDAEEVFRNWGCDPEVSKYVTWSTHQSIDDTNLYLESAFLVDMMLQ
jgi:ribosomal-protein-alanine N-acetyltransferase